MKNRKLTYILLPAVIAIWGIIFYRIFSGTGHDEKGNANVYDTAASNPYDQAPDTFSLIADYRDPFLGKLESNDRPKMTSEQNVQPRVKELKPAPVQAPWPSISYSGMIKNQRSSVQLALLQVNGQSFTVKAGGRVEDLDVLRIYRDSIELRFNEEKKVFRK